MCHLWLLAVSFRQYSVPSLHILTICNFIISRFGFEYGIWVLMAPVPDHCALACVIVYLQVIFIHLENLFFKKFEKRI